MDIKEKLKKYLDDNLNTPTKFRAAKIFSPFQNMECASYEDSTPMFGSTARKSSINNIDTILDNIDDNKKFTNVLFRYIDSKGCKDSDIYNKALVDRRLFSKIRSDINYHPKKETVIQLGLALELNTKELEELLESAEYSLPKNNKFDLIIRFCFDEHIYDVMNVNELLQDYDCKLLVKE